MSKSLKEINHEKIIEEFNDLDSFYKDLNLLANRLKGIEKRTIRDMSVYHKLLFSVKTMSLEEDVIDMHSIAVKNIAILKGIKVKSKSVPFLINLIKHNIGFVAK